MNVLNVLNGECIGFLFHMRNVHLTKSPHKIAYKMNGETNIEICVLDWCVLFFTIANTRLDNVQIYFCCQM